MKLRTNLVILALTSLVMIVSCACPCCSDGIERDRSLAKSEGKVDSDGFRNIEGPIQIETLRVQAIEVLDYSGNVVGRLNGDGHSGNLYLSNSDDTSALAASCVEGAYVLSVGSFSQDGGLVLRGMGSSDAPRGPSISIEGRDDSGILLGVHSAASSAPPSDARISLFDKNAKEVIQLSAKREGGGEIRAIPEDQSPPTTVFPKK